MSAKRVSTQSPIHWVLILDDSQSMQPHAKAVNDAVSSFVRTMQGFVHGSNKTYCRISIITFGNQASTVMFHQPERQINAKALHAIAGASGQTYVGNAIRHAIALLKETPGVETDFQPYVLLLTDGEFNDPEEATIAAHELQNLEILAGKPQVIALGFGEARLASLQSVVSWQDGKPLAKIMHDLSVLASILPDMGSITAAGSLDGVAGINRNVIEEFAI